MGSRIYQAYSELLSSIREVSSKGFSLLNTAKRSIFTIRLQLYFESKNKDLAGPRPAR